MRDDAITLEQAPSALNGPSWAFPALGRLAASWHDGDLPVLSDWSIRSRFALLVGLALGCAAVFGAVSWRAEMRIDAMLARQDGYRRMNDMVGDVRAKVADLQNHEEQFLRDRDDVSRKQVADDTAMIQSTLAAMGQAAESEEMAAVTSDLYEAFGGLPAILDGVAGAVERQGVSETSGLRGQLRSAAKAMEDELKMWPNAAPLMMPMLQMRLAEKNFMIYGGDEHVGQHRRYANQFDLALDGSSLPASTREEFTRMLSAYGSGMAGFVDGTTQLHDQVAQLRARFAAMQPILQKAFTLARLGMSQAITEQEEERRATGRLTAAVGLVAAVSFILAALVLAHSVTRPVRRIQGAMERLAAGDHAVPVPGISRRDEIGDMAKAVAVFKENAIQMVRMQQKQQEIRLEAEAANRMRMAALADNFESAVKDVAEQVSTQALAIRATAESMATRGEAGESRSLSVAEAAESSRRSVAAVAEAAEELAGSVQDISFRVAESSHIVEDAVAELARANRRVSGLAEVAGDIDRVVKMISDIAQRTNMLSLNATIEAQRAGEAGKGFAVVAEEVRHLAHQTADSTAEIARQVAAIKSATGDTVDAMADIGSAITRMDQIAGQVAAAVNRQAQVTDKIGRCVDDVRRETRQVTDGVVSVTQSAARYCGAAVRVLWAADDLSRPAGTLKAEVDGFLKTVRAS